MLKTSSTAANRSILRVMPFRIYCIYVGCLLVLLVEVAIAIPTEKEEKHFWSSEGEQSPSQLFFLNDYDLLDYEPIAEQKLAGNLPIEVELHLFNRTLPLQLVADNPQDDHAGRRYHGHVKGDAGSAAYGSFLEGVFSGSIRLSNGHEIWVELTKPWHGPDANTRSKLFHSIIYDGSSVNWERFSGKSEVDAHEGGKRLRREAMSDEAFSPPAVQLCGLTDDLYRSMLKEQEEMAVAEHRDGPVIASLVLSSSEADSESNEKEFDVAKTPMLDHSPYRRGSPLFDSPVRPAKKAIGGDFHKNNGPHLYPDRTCGLHLQTDHLLYEKVYLGEGEGDHARTKKIIEEMLENHVAAVNRVYESTDFKGVRGINFAIRKMTIHNGSSCFHSSPHARVPNPFCNANDIADLLNANSRLDHSAFCLAYLFTHKSFKGGTLGLAWVAGASPLIAGGICHRAKDTRLGSIFNPKSLNTGVVSLASYGRKIPSRVSQLVFAHEIGHSFGASHDEGPCRPGADSFHGDYIMSEVNTAGDRYNNDKFSPCSVTSMSEVLHTILRHPPTKASGGFGSILGTKRNCFEERTTPFCGNQMVEEGEECDCGYSQDECDAVGDRCCEPGLSLYHRCQLRFPARCSPSEGPCCDATRCNFALATERKVCRETSECAHRQYCDGHGAQCPVSMPKADGTPCEDSTRVCDGGACNGSLCELVGLRDCVLTTGLLRPCHLACEKNGVCWSSFELEEFSSGKFHQREREGQPGLLLRPGTLCKNRTDHYCDSGYRCIERKSDNNPLTAVTEFVMDIAERVYKWFKNTFFRW